MQHSRVRARVIAPFGAGGNRSCRFRPRRGQEATNAHPLFVGFAHRVPFAASRAGSPDAQLGVGSSPVTRTPYFRVLRIRFPSRGFAAGAIPPGHLARRQPPDARLLFEGLVRSEVAVPRPEGSGEAPLRAPPISGLRRRHRRPEASGPTHLEPDADPRFSRGNRCPDALGAATAGRAPMHVDYL